MFIQNGSCIQITGSKPNAANSNVQAASYQNLMWNSWNECNMFLFDSSRRRRHHHHSHWITCLVVDFEASKKQCNFSVNSKCEECVEKNIIGLKKHEQIERTNKTSILLLLLAISTADFSNAAYDEFIQLWTGWQRRKIFITGIEWDICMKKYEKWVEHKQKKSPHSFFFCFLLFRVLFTPKAQHSFHVLFTIIKHALLPFIFRAAHSHTHSILNTFLVLSFFVLRVSSSRCCC